MNLHDENYKTIEQLKRFKYFNLLFKEYENYDDKIHGFYVNINKTNIPFVKSFIRFMYPKSFQRKIETLSINSCILMRRETTQFNPTNHIFNMNKRKFCWSFDFSFDINCIVANIRINRQILEMYRKESQQHIFIMDHVRLI